MPEDRKPQKIELRLVAGGRGNKVFIDGVEVPYVAAVRLTAGAEDVTRLALEIVALDGVTVNGEAEADIWRKVFSPPKLKEEEGPLCPYCGFNHAPVPDLMNGNPLRLCCRCGARAGRLPYGWCAECTEDAPRE